MEVIEVKMEHRDGDRDVGGCRDREEDRTGQVEMEAADHRDGEATDYLKQEIISLCEKFAMITLQY